MLIGKRSPFRQIPDELNGRQATFLDGIRYSVEMADLAYSRLRTALWSLSTQHDEQGCEDKLSTFADPFLDAWSIVDSVHRLRQLLEQMPGLKRAKAIPYQLFTRKTKAAEDFRHTIQHLRSELDQMASQNWPVWGVLDWISVIDEHTGLVRCCVITSGKTITGKYPVCNPAGKDIEPPVDHITLQCKGDRLSLSNTMRSVGSVVKSLEQSLAKQFQGMSSTGSDLMVRVDIQLQLEQSDEDSCA